jgi:hypothetical protein
MKKAATTVEIDVYEPTEDMLKELSHTIVTLDEENTRLRDAIAIGQWDVDGLEKINAEELIKELREKIRILEIDNLALRQSRDMFQNRNAEIIHSRNYFLKLCKKLQKELEQGGQHV